MPPRKLQNSRQHQKVKQAEKKPVPPTRVAQQKFIHNSRRVITTIRPIRDPHVITTITPILNPQFVSVHESKSDKKVKIGSIYFPGGRMRLTHVGGPIIDFGAVRIGRYLIKRTATGQEGEQEFDDLKKVAASMFNREIPNENIPPKIKEIPSNLSSNFQQIKDFQKGEGRTTLFEVYEKNGQERHHPSRGGIDLPQAEIGKNIGIIKDLINLSCIIDMQVDDIYSLHSILLDAKASFDAALRTKLDTPSNALFQNAVRNLRNNIDNIFSWKEDDERVVFLKIVRKYVALINKKGTHIDPRTVYNDIKSKTIKQDDKFKKIASDIFNGFFRNRVLWYSKLFDELNIQIDQSNDLYPYTQQNSAKSSSTRRRELVPLREDTDEMDEEGPPAVDTETVPVRRRELVFLWENTNAMDTDM